VTNFARELAAAVAEDPERPAVKLDDLVLTYGLLDAGAQRAAGLLRAGAETARELVDAGPDTVTLATLPLFHVFGMNSVMNVSIRARGLLTLLPRFEPGKALELIERDKVTTFAGVPTMYTAMLHHPERERHDVTSIDLCVSGGSALPVEVLRGFDDAFDTKVLEGYGLSETTGMGSFNLRDRERKPGSIGVPVGGTGFRLVDDEGGDVAAGEPGEIAMRGPFVMSGYPRRVWFVDELPKGRPARSSSARSRRPSG
jgi:long-chain acyl-CoA synthetase